MNINETAQKPPEPHQRQDKNSQELTELINQLSTASDILEEPKEQEVPEDEHSQELNDLLSSISSSSLEEKDEKAPGTKDSTQYNQKEDQIRTRYIPEPVPENTPSRSQKNDVTGPRTGPRKRHNKDYEKVDAPAATSHEATKNEILETNLKYVYDDNPQKLQDHIITLLINIIPTNHEMCLKAVLHMFRAFKFDDLFGSPDAERRLIKRFENRWSNSHLTGSGQLLYTIPLWLCENQIKHDIPEEEYVCGQLNQQIKPIEIAVIMKVITRQILLRRLEGKDYAILANKYFLTSLKDKFKAAAGRRLNETKLTRITELLSEFSIIKKIKRWDDGEKQLPNLYKMGDANVLSDDKLGKGYKYNR